MRIIFDFMSIRADIEPVALFPCVEPLFILVPARPGFCLCSCVTSYRTVPLGGTGPPCWLAEGVDSVLVRSVPFCPRCLRFYSYRPAQSLPWRVVVPSRLIFQFSPLIPLKEVPPEGAPAMLAESRDTAAVGGGGRLSSFSPRPAAEVGTPIATPRSSGRRYHVVSFNFLPRVW